MRIDLHHVHIFASDIDATVEWWSRHLNAQVIFDQGLAGARNVFLAVGTGRLHVYDQAPRDNGRGAIHHLGVRVSDLRDVWRCLKATPKDKRFDRAPASPRHGSARPDHRSRYSAASDGPVEPNHDVERKAARLGSLWASPKAMGVLSPNGLREHDHWRYVMISAPDDVLVELFEFDDPAAPANLSGRPQVAPP